MKKLIFFCSIIIAFFLISCGNAKTSSLETPGEKTTPTPVKEEPKQPEPVIKDVVPEKVFAGEFTVGNVDTSESEGGKFMEQITKFMLMISLPGDSTLVPIQIDIEDSWRPGEKSSGYHVKMKDLFNEIVKLKPNNFLITTRDGKIRNVAILPIFKDNKDGTVGELVNSKRELYPYVYLDEQRFGY